MILSSTILIPELNHYFFSYLDNFSILKRYEVEFPTDIEEIYLAQSSSSFIRLLFDENTTQTYYNYRYRNENFKSVWPLSVQSRLSIFQSAKYFICDDSEEAVLNPFLLEIDDVMLLDKLLNYRLYPQSTTIQDINYNSLTTNLSKLIYLYLDLEVNKNYSNYNNMTIISKNNPKTILEYCFELFLIDKYFIYVENLNNF
jgi:hypothetical protein